MDNSNNIFLIVDGLISEWEDIYSEAHFREDWDYSLMPCVPLKPLEELRFKVLNAKEGGHPQNQLKFENNHFV